MNPRQATTQTVQEDTMHATTRTRTLPVLGALVAAGIAGFMFGAANAEPAVTTPPPALLGPVNVSLILEESGEVRSIDLTDADGNDVPVGSVAEEFPWMERDYAGEKADGDQSIESDG